MQVRAFARDVFVRLKSLGGSGPASFLFYGIGFAHEQQDGGGLAILGVELESIVKLSFCGQPE